MQLYTHCRGNLGVCSWYPIRNWVKDYIGVPVYNLNPQIVRMGPQYKITNQINYPNQIPH